MVQVDHITARIFGNGDIFSPLPQALLPNLNHVPEFRRAQCGQYGAPYFWGTLGILYREDKVQPPPRSWRDLLVPDDNLKGHIGMLDSYLDTLVPPLAMLRQPLGSGDRGVLRDAFSLLKEQSSWVLTYEHPLTYLRQQRQTEQLYMAQGYSSDRGAMNAASDHARWRFVVPDEGTFIWLDCLAVFAHSPRKALALEFINFLNLPEIAALNAEQALAAPTNDAAMLLLSSSFRDNKEVFPPESILKKSRLSPVLDTRNMEIRNRITLSVLKNHETQ